MQVITSPQFLHLLPSSRGHMMINASASSSISLILSAWVKTTSGQCFFRASLQALLPQSSRQHGTLHLSHNFTFHASVSASAAAGAPQNSLP
nr:MAG: hypothetical protein [Bacteriophage sp.]